MKRSTDGSIIVTEVGESIKHPEAPCSSCGGTGLRPGEGATTCLDCHGSGTVPGVPEENIGQPEFTDWRTRAFALAAQLNDVTEQLEALKLINAANEFELRITRQMLELAEEHINRRNQRSVWRRLIDFLWEIVDRVRGW